MPLMGSYISCLEFLNLFDSCEILFMVADLFYSVPYNQFSSSHIFLFEEATQIKWYPGMILQRQNHSTKFKIMTLQCPTYTCWEF